MNRQETAPYGEWKSEISRNAVTAGARGLSAPRVDRESGRAFFCESRPDGTKGIKEILPDGVRDVLPAEYSAASSVYEYGGGPYAVLPGPTLVFSNKGKSVMKMDVESGEFSEIVASPVLRYADFDGCPTDASCVVAVEEDHTNDAPSEVKNFIAVINLSTGDMRRIASGADFYVAPRFSPDGKKLCWLEWNFPDMHFTGAKLVWADWNDGSAENAETIADVDQGCVCEPRWGPDGTLFFSQERSNFRQLFRIRGGEVKAEPIELDGTDEMDLGNASWFLGCHTYAILSAKYLLAAPFVAGANKIILVDLESEKWLNLGLSLNEIGNDSVYRLDDTSAMIIATEGTSASALYKLDVGGESPSLTLVRTSTDQNFSPDLFSAPQQIALPAQNPERTVHGFFWAPHNPLYKGPENAKPPLILYVHGGPTWFFGPGLALEMQYWTSRGYACFAINYTGSTCHGKAYREAQYANWGVIDIDDNIAAVDHLSGQGLIDKTRVGITGGSAGGYSVLQSMVAYPDVFAGGVCLYGVSDLKKLDESTHKLESQYLQLMLYKPGASEEEQERVNHERSPIFHASKITAALLMIHGEEDHVVPIGQAYEMEEEIRKHGGNVKVVAFPGEGHGFRQAKHLLIQLDEAEKWWRKSLLRAD